MQRASRAHAQRDEAARAADEERDMQAGEAGADASGDVEEEDGEVPLEAWLDEAIEHGELERVTRSCGRS